MAVEIERRFLVIDDSWRKDTLGTLYRQGYLYFQEFGVLRIRVAGNRGFLTLKLLKDDISALEYEYEIPQKDAEDMLSNVCYRRPVEKIRHHIFHGGMIWEVDEFCGDNEGLVIAEIELHDRHQEIHLPSWVGEEITGNRRYLNASLYKDPYTKWCAHDTE